MFRMDGYDNDKGDGLMFQQTTITRKAWIIFILLSFITFINVVFIVSLKIHNYTNEKVLHMVDKYCIPWAVISNFLMFMIASSNAWYTPIS